MDTYMPYWTGREMLKKDQLLNPKILDGEWVKYSDVDALQNNLKEQETLLGTIKEILGPAKYMEILTEHLKKAKIYVKPS